MGGVIAIIVVDLIVPGDPVPVIPFDESHANHKYCKKRDKFEKYLKKHFQLDLNKIQDLPTVN